MHYDDVNGPQRAMRLRRLAAVVSAWDWPTIGVLAGCIVVWICALLLPTGWAAVQWALLVFALALHSSLSHEILHGHPFHSDTAGTVIGLMQPGLFVPYLRFKMLHLAHHRDSDLTDPYDDPESNYMDPAVWCRLARWQQRALIFNNTLMGRMLIGPLIGNAVFYADEWRLIRGGDRSVALQWLAHLPGVLLTLWLVSLSTVPLWLYLAACYAALSILRIRTFLEHQAHEKAAGRSVIIEDRGVLAFLFLNNNYHVVHHMHPQIPWYRLPALYRARKDRFLRMNRGYVFGSYGDVFRRFLFKTKDPVAHPLWQPPRD